MTCYCESCSENPKSTYTEEFRHKKEVEYVAKRKAPWIKEYLSKIKRIRGEAEYHRLRNAVLIERERLNQQHAEMLEKRSQLTTKASGQGG